MKIYLYPVLIGGFVVTYIFQAIMFGNVSLQNQVLQKQLDELNKKIDNQQSISKNEIIPAITKITETNCPGTLPLTSASTIGLDSSDLLSEVNLSQTLGTQSDKVTLKPSWKNVDVYETNKASSRILGKMESGKSYAIVEKGLDWYQIKLDSQTNAWVQAQFVYETI